MLGWLMGTSMNTFIFILIYTDVHSAIIKKAVDFSTAFFFRKMLSYKPSYKKFRLNLPVAMS